MRINSDFKHNEIKWKDLLSQNCRSKIKVSGNLLKKICKEDSKKEFYKLVFWKSLFDLYSRRFNINVNSPKPYLSDNNILIMEYVPGINLNYLKDIEDENKYKIMKGIGQLLKIKENEELVHGNLDLNEIIVHSGVYLIGVGKSKKDDIKEEHEKFIESLKTHYGNIDSALQTGYFSIPEITLYNECIKSCNSNYEKFTVFYEK